MTAQATTQDQASSTTKVGHPWLGKLMIAGFMGAVVAIECLVAYLLFPSPEEVAALAQQNLEKKLPSTLANEDAAIADDEEGEAVEIDLGEYSVTVRQTNSTTVLRVDFHLVGTVLETDGKEIQSLFDRNIHRFRDQVLVEIRNSEPADLADPGLALIKRRILEKSNALFGKPILRSVVFSEFSYFEQ
jgi:flagellar FliL protein